MTIDRERIRDYYFKDLTEAYDNIKTLDADERDFYVSSAAMYYQYLVSNGVMYGRLALEVIENKGLYGKCANINLKSQSIFEGISEENIPMLREQIIISLAYRDAKLRLGSDVADGTSYLDAVETYHISEFTKYTTPYAWGGLVMRELFGSGSWMDFYEKDAGFLDGIIECIRKSSTKSYSGDYSVERMLQSTCHTFKVFSTGIDEEFSPMIRTFNKEMAASIWKLGTGRFQEISDESEPSEGSLVCSKVFKVLKAGERAIDASVEEEPSDAGIGMLMANMAIDQLLRHPEKYEMFEGDVMRDAASSLDGVDGAIPGLRRGILDAAAKAQVSVADLANLSMFGSDADAIRAEKASVESFAASLAFDTERQMASFFEDVDAADFLATLMGTGGTDA